MPSGDMFTYDSSPLQVNIRILILCIILLALVVVELIVIVRIFTLLIRIEKNHTPGACIIKLITAVINSVT